MAVPKQWITYNNIDLFRWAENGAYYYITDYMQIDADGSPNAYNPADTGLDALANAEFPRGNWQSILVPDPINNATPFVQVDGPYKGYYVSQTSLKDPNLNDWDSKKYVDARNVPYIVFPGNFYALQGSGVMGDLVMVRNLSNGLTSSAIVADGGPPADPLGEISIGLVEKLGGVNPNPRNGRGMPGGRIQYVVFPRSKQTPAWPLSIAEIDRLSKAELDKLGGWASIPT